MSAKHKRDTVEAKAKPPYMIFDFERGYVFGPGAPEGLQGKLPYWNTGGMKPASWREEK